MGEKMSFSLISWLSSSRPPLPKETDGPTAAANREVVKVVNAATRKRGSYHHYDDETRAKIAKYSCECGNKAAVDKFTKELGFVVTESSVRNMKKAYLAKLRKEKDPDRITSLPHGARGRPLMLLEYDQDVSRYIKSLREAGGIVNRSIIIAAAKGIVSHKNPGLLKEHGGPISISSSWAESFLRRIGFVKRKGTKAARKLPENFAEIKHVFLERVKSEVETWSIPPALILNWDQTGSKLVPVSEWTMEREGTKQVPIVGKEDKREITVVMTITASGLLLPFQVIYQGKTVGCHAKVTFPHEWNITQSDSHWSTESTMLEFVDKVIVPYVKQTRDELQLPSDHPALALFDVFKAHRCESLLDKLRQNHIHQVFIPAGCTGELQPLDVSVNSVFKDSMKSHFARWYAAEVKEALEQGLEIANVKVDLRASTVKPLHGNWLMMAFTYLKDNKQIIQQGFEKTGILSVM